MPALIFDCDGVLVDTEHDAHLLAFNRMWAEFGVDWSWSREDYSRKLAISGGKERLASLRTEPRFRRCVDVPRDDAEWRDLVGRWHRRKTELYVEMIEAGEVPARPGVQRLAQEAQTAGWQLAVASSAASASVDAVLHHVVGASTAQLFTVVSGDSVPAKKPHPAVYLAAARQVDVPVTECVAIEDSPAGLAAALAAGIRCVVTPTSVTRSADLTGAALIVSSLGDEGNAGTVLENPYGLPVGDEVGIHDLAMLLKV